MKNLKNKLLAFNFICLAFMVQGCSSVLRRDPLPSSDPPLPPNFPDAAGKNSSAMIGWKEYFKDTNLKGLIETALQNNQELNIQLQEIIIAQNEVAARKGEYMPKVNAGAGAGPHRGAHINRFPVRRSPPSRRTAARGTAARPGPASS